ncbi:MAG: hypothetical protein EBS23_10080, partial [Betaproteobacteria bacterium]|nr:hypothetical protein [Betaproteobacteria bacterium]
GANSGVSLAYNMVGGNATGDYSFGLTASGFAGRISYDNSSGVTGQTLSIQNGANGGTAKSYTLLYSLADFDTKIAMDTSATAVALARSVSDDGVTRANLVSNGTWFRGTFTGLGNQISNLALTGTDRVGIFRYGGHESVFRDLSITNANVTGGFVTGIVYGQTECCSAGKPLSNLHISGTVSASNEYTGGLIGYDDGGVSSNIFANNLSVSGTSYVGGFSGRSFLRTLSNSAFSNVTVIGSGERVGGLGGEWHAQSISSVSFNGNVTGTGRVGGVAGYLSSNLSGLTLSGVVTGSSYVGGVAGEAGANIALVAAANTVRTQTGSRYVGGIVGSLSHGFIDNSEFTGMIQALQGGTAVTGLASANLQDFGGLVGYLGHDAHVRNAHFNVESATIAGSKVVGVGALYGTQFTDWRNGRDSSGAVLASPNANIAARSLAIANYGSLVQDTVDGFYKVDTAQSLKDLLGFSQQNASGINTLKFKLGADLTPGSFGSAATSENFTYIPYFAGSAFKGTGFAVNDWTLAPAQQQSNIGFLGAVRGTAVSDLTVNLAAGTSASPSVRGNNYVGGVIGSMIGGSLSNVRTTGAVSGSLVAGA